MEKAGPTEGSAVSIQILVNAAASGDEAAFAALVAGHYDQIHRLAWRWCGNRADAEDIAHDVCVKLARAIRAYRGEAAFTTWLYRIVFTTATDRIRGRQRLRLVEPSKMVTLVEQGGGYSHQVGRQHDADASTLQADLWDEVRRLPDQQRDAVLLVYGEDMAHGEAARILGCSEKTVSWHLHEARKRLKASIEAMG